MESTVIKQADSGFGGVDVQENPGGTPEARSRLCVCLASFLMTFAMGRIPRAGSQQMTEDEMAGWHHRLNGRESE